MFKFFLFFLISLMQVVFCGGEEDHKNRDGGKVAHFCSHVPYNHPATDLQLSALPRLSKPPFYAVTFPNGIQILVLGTTHIIPMAAYEPYALMRDLIGVSCHLFCEVGNDCQSNRVDLSHIFVTAKDIDKFRESSQKINSQFFTESKVLAEKVEEDLANTLTGLSWYEKAGIICESSSVFDYSLGIPPYYHKFLRIGGKIVRVTTNENNAAILPSILYFHCVDSQEGGVDHQLGDFSKRVVESLDTEEINSRKLTGDLREQNLFEVNYYTQLIAEGHRIIDRRPAECYAAAEADWYHSRSGDDNDFVITYRNKVWFARLQQLRDSHSRLNFCWVGKGHLPGLFEMFRSGGCKVSERLPLDSIEAILHAGYLQEHVTRVAAMKKPLGD